MAHDARRSEEDAAKRQRAWGEALNGNPVKLIDGVKHKLCTGPAHDEPEYLPATDKFFYRRKTGKRAGDLTSRCHLCMNWTKLKSPGSHHGYVTRQNALPFVREASHRIGSAELSRRTGVALNTIEGLLLGKTKRMQKKTLRKIMLELVSIKRKNEFSINPYSAWRVVKRLNGYQDVCAGCGCDLGNYTEGCETCWSRKNKRERRGLTPEGDGIE